MESLRKCSGLARVSQAARERKFCKQIAATKKLEETNAKVVLSARAALLLRGFSFGGLPWTSKPLTLRTCGAPPSRLQT